MELLPHQAKPATSNLLTRQLTPQNLSPQSPDAFLSQLASPLVQSSIAAQTDGVTANTLPHDSLPHDSLALDSLAPHSQSSLVPTPSNPAAGSPELREAFQNFVGQTFFSEMIKACRSGQQPSAYFHGGRAEEIFQGQLDQVLSEELSKSSADKIADPMFELFMLKRQS